MTDENVKYRPLSREELIALAGEELPEKAVTSLINANVAAPLNPAVALNIASADQPTEAPSEESPA